MRERSERAQKVRRCVASVNPSMFCGEALSFTNDVSSECNVEKPSIIDGNGLKNQDQFDSFPGNSKNNFFPKSKSSPIVFATYGHVFHAAIFYTKPKGPYFHHVKYHRDWSSHSGVEICA